MGESISCFFVLTVLLWGLLFLSAKEAFVVQEEFQQDIRDNAQN